ncbi:Pentatricopeptide repeat-containing protein [Sesamum alatum]|uniref:Pentatricopeptide repeat-containing protein n=1 Tax=Sesamum alatum TaxID=300844 RepID=A0AAE1XLI1_9LAMI|nr:Pentatricopeptide repeat-containing protein [Sesamum alatum]
MRFKRLHTTTLRSLRNRTRTDAQTPPRQNAGEFFKPSTNKSLPNLRSNKFSDSDIVKCNIAITDHMRHGQCDSALRLFKSMPRKTSVSYNTMISGYILNGDFQLAHHLFDEMPLKDLDMSLAAMWAMLFLPCIVGVEALTRHMKCSGELKIRMSSRGTQSLLVMQDMVLAKKLSNILNQ